MDRANKFPWRIRGSRSADVGLWQRATGKTEGLVGMKVSLIGLCSLGSVMFTVFRAFNKIVKNKNKNKNNNTKNQASAS